MIEQWKIDHLMLCLHEQYRFDRRPEFLAIREARMHVRDTPEDSPDYPACVQELFDTVKAALLLLQKDRIGDGPDSSSWVQGVIEMVTV